MSQASDDFSAAGRGQLLEVFGDAVTHIDSAGTSTPITADVHGIDVETVTKGDGTDERQVCDVVVSLADVPSPSELDSFVIGGVTWKADGLPAVTGSMATYHCVRVTPIERTARGYRR